MYTGNGPNKKKKKKKALFLSLYLFVKDGCVDDGVLQEVEDVVLDRGVSEQLVLLTQVVHT